MDLDRDDSSASSSSSSSHSHPDSRHFSLPPHCTATASKRKAGRKKFRETRHPVYKGVRQRNGNKWVCEVREPFKKSRIWLGTFPTPEMAARAHDVAALALRGRFASLNFPDSAWLLPPAKSSSAEDIQAAVLEAANAFKTPAPSSSSSSSARLAASKKVLETSPSSDSPQLQDVEFASADPGSSQKVPDGSTTVFLDEEALFNMPGLIDSMAEGLLLTPPALSRGFNWDDATSHINLSLWDDD